MDLLRLHPYGPLQGSVRKVVMFEAFTIALFAAALLAPLIILALRMARAQRQYIRMYQRAYPTAELPDPDGGSPLGFLNQVGRAGNGLRAYDEEQADPALEQLRQEVRKRTQMAVGWGLGAPVIFVLIIVQIVGN